MAVVAPTLSLPCHLLFVVCGEIEILGDHWKIHSPESKIRVQRIVLPSLSSGLGMRLLINGPAAVS